MNDEPAASSFSACLLDYNQRAKRYIDFIKHIDTRRFKTGLHDIDKTIRGVAPGEVLTIIAYSGTYKSAYLQHMLQRAAATTELKHIMFSMEMPVETVFEREIQMAAAITGEEVERMYRNISEDTRWLHNKGFDRGGKHLIVCEKGRLTLDQIGKLVEVARVKHGEVGAIGIDYLGLMSGEGRTVFERVAEISYGLKDLAKQLMLPVIVLGQVHRGYAASAGKEIEMDAAKGGGDIEAGADYMFGLMMSEEKELILKVLKNRKGRNNVYFKLQLDPDTLSFTGAEPWEPPKKKSGGVI